MMKFAYYEPWELSTGRIELPIMVGHRVKVKRTGRKGEVTEVDGNIIGVKFFDGGYEYRKNATLTN